MFKSYSELRQLQTFEERFEYLKLGGTVGRRTFGFDRYLNQSFYNSREWKRVRNDIIVRDGACDLGIPDRAIYGKIIVHHITPITIDDVEQGADCLFNPDNLICTSHNTSEAIHYGDASLLTQIPKERQKGDTTLWTVS